MKKKPTGISRREFTKIATAGAATLGLGATAFGKTPRIKKVKPLERGSKIGFVAPATRVKPEWLERSKKSLETLGMKWFHQPDILERHGAFAGTDERRLNELHAMYRDKTIDGIWAIGGGYGTTRIVDRLDFRLIKKNPKPLIGYSDITGLLNTIYQRTGNPCIHGPVAAGNFEPDFVTKCMTPLFGINSPFSIPLSPENEKRAVEDKTYEYYPITPGRAQGRLAGGNLSLLVALVGTKHAVKTKNSLVFIEDIREKPYRIDRMLTQLISSGFFEGARGVLFGVSVGCENDADDNESFSLKEVITERIGGLGIPAAYGYSFGHIREHCFLPVGVKAEMDTNAKTITLLEDVYEKRLLKK